MYYVQCLLTICQISSLTAKLLFRLTLHFEKELEKVQPGEIGAEVSKRYKQIMDSVRIRQRKLFRFTKYVLFVKYIFLHADANSYLGY